MTDISIDGGENNINSVQALRDALEAFSERLAIAVYLYRAPAKKREKYAVWGVTAISAPFWADDGERNIKAVGEIWYYSTDAMDTVVNDLLSTLWSGGADCTVREVGYDDDLAQVVHVIDWGIICGESGPY